MNVQLFHWIRTSSNNHTESYALLVPLWLVVLVIFFMLALIGAVRGH